MTYETITVFHDDTYSYTYFASIHDFWVAYPNLRHVHEVIIDTRPQRMKFDIDIPAGWGGREQDIIKLVESVIGAAIAIYDDYCYIQTLTSIKMEDFLVTRAKNPKDEQGKWGVHIIAPFYMYSAGDAQIFADHVLDRLRSMDGMRMDGMGMDGMGMIDRNIYKSTQNFRLYGMSKSESPERVKLHWVEAFPLGKGTHNLQELSLIGHYTPWNTVLTCTFGERATTGLTRLIEFDESSGALNQILAPLLADHIFRARKGNIIAFDRVRPSFCALCNEIHHNDNTLFVTIGPSESAPVYERCRQKQGAYRIIGHLGTVQKAPSLSEMIAPALILPSQPQPPPPYEDVCTQRTQKSLEEFPQSSMEIYHEPKIRQFPFKPTLLVKAPMKMGKTKELCNYIRTYFNSPSQTIIFLTFRQTFTKSIERTLIDQGLSGFISYADIPQYTIRAGDANRLIIQVESLTRLQLAGRAPPDLLVMDESESVIEQFMSGNVRDLGGAFAVFEWLVHYSSAVVAMDANLCERTTELIKKIRVQDQSPHIMINTYPNATGDVYTVVQSKVWMSILVERAKKCFVAGTKLAVFSNSLADAKVVEATLRTSLPNGVKIQLYSSETSMVLKQQHFADVHKYWSELDVMICTPTVSAGISYELAGFEVIFAKFTDRSCTVETSRQMLGRIRQCREFVIAFDYSVRHYPTEVGELRQLLTLRRHIIGQQSDFDELPTIPMTYAADGRAQVEDSAFLMMIIMNMRIKHLSRNQFVRRFIGQIREIGAEVKVDESEYTPIDLKVIKLKVEREGAEVIAKAPDVGFNEFSTLIEKVERSNATDVDIAAISKYTIRETYDVRAEEVNVQFIMEYGSGVDRERYKNLRLMLPTKYPSSGVTVEFIVNSLKPPDVGEINIARLTTYEKHLAAVSILKTLGLPGPFNTGESGFISGSLLILRRREIEVIFQIYGHHFDLRKIHVWSETNKTILSNINNILRMYACQLKPAKKGSNEYILSRSNKYDKFLDHDWARLVG